jgi:6-pyruvoyltetrahydropterin/6-carboxytetrahydropterin synthase
MIYLTRRERFSAAHRMFRQDWSDEKNLEVFGKCSNPNWHGHNYIIWVTVKGEPGDEHGFVMNINTLKKIIQKKIIEKLDHRNINLDVDFMKDKIATTENLVVAIWDQLKAEIENEGA